MQTIVTLTMNPALDKSTRTPTVAPEDKLRCETLQVEPGGGGVNVSRAIHKLGGVSQLLYVAGGMNGQAIETLLQADGLSGQRIPIAGNTRESFTVLEESSRHQYRFNMPGPTLAAAEWQQVLEIVAALPQPDYLVASGSLPPGVPDDFYALLAGQMAGTKTRVIVDTSGRALRELVQHPAPVYLIKPNLAELAELAGQEIDDDQEIIAAAQRIIDESGIQQIVVSLGAGGVIVVDDRRAARQRTPTVPIRSKIGAGDSTVAGIVLALARGLPGAEAVRFGVASGAAAVMTPGSELCRRADAERLFDSMQRDQLLEYL